MYVATLSNVQAKLSNHGQSASGISFKSQFLYLLVYITRYLDLLWTFYRSDMLYNTFFKIVFIAAQTYTVYLMLKDYKPTVDPNNDTFRVEYLLGASAILAILFPYKYTLTEVCLEDFRCASLLELTLTCYRSSGLSPSGLNPSQSFHNSSCCNELEKQKR